MGILGWILGFNEELFTLVNKTQFAKPPNLKAKKQLLAILKTSKTLSATLNNCL
jgi:hypothetical protein